MWFAITPPESTGGPHASHIARTAAEKPPSLQGLSAAVGVIGRCSFGWTGDNGGPGFDGVAYCHARAGFVSPSICLITWSGLLAAYASLKVHLGGEPSADVMRLWNLGLALLVAYWVRVDS